MSEQKRYSMTKVPRTTFSRITALVDMPEHGVKAGDIGGLIESEFNLPQDGTGWVDDSSSVSDLCQVKAGLICDSSNLEENVIVEGGKIEDSFVTGNLVISGDTVIKDCEIMTATVRQSEIKSSSLENIKNIYECHIEESKICSRRRFTSDDILTIIKSKIDIGSGRAKKLTLINSTLMTKSFSSHEPIHIENAVLDIRLKLYVSDESHSLSNKHSKTMIKGLVEKPIEMRGSDIKMTNSYLLDAVKVTGDIHVHNSKISGIAILEMKKADMYDCSFSEMATVRQVTDDVVILDKIILSGDDQYEC